MASPFSFPDPVHVSNAQGNSPVVMVCEHASNVIPAELNGLGLSPEAAVSHAAWDLGAFDLAQKLAQRLDAPLVSAGLSRLVYDCNRPTEAPSAIPTRSEVHDIPGNIGLGASARAARAAQVYRPFHDTLARILTAHPAPTVLVTVHSFTPVYNGERRDVELGLLHATDDRLARAMLTHAPHTGWHSALNAPYGPGDGVLHTLDLHATPKGMLNVMIELRNDLIADVTGVHRAADRLSELLVRALADLGIAIQVHE